MLFRSDSFKAIAGNQVAWILFERDKDGQDPGLLIGHNEEDVVFMYSLPHIRKFHRWIGQYIAYLEAQKAQKGKAK